MTILHQKRKHIPLSDTKFLNWWLFSFQTINIVALLFCVWAVIFGSDTLSIHFWMLAVLSASIYLPCIIIQKILLERLFRVDFPRWYLSIIGIPLGWFGLYFVQSWFLNKRLHTTMISILWIVVGYGLSLLEYSTFQVFVHFNLDYELNQPRFMIAYYVNELGLMWISFLFLLYVCQSLVQGWLSAKVVLWMRNREFATLEKQKEY